MRRRLSRSLVTGRSQCTRIFGTRGENGLLAERLMIETGSCHGIGNSFLWDTIDRCGALIFDRAELVEVCRHEQVQQVIAQLVLNALCMMRDARPSGFRAVTRDAYEATLKFTCSNIVQFLTSEQFQATVKGTGASLQVDRSDVCGSSSNDCCSGSGEHIYICVCVCVCARTHACIYTYTHMYV